LIDVRPGETHIQVEGSDLSSLHNESGGHRIQRVPPTEKRGRVHTSTVTVAVIDSEVDCDSTPIPEHELRVEWYSGTGKGGQHRNKHQNSCRLTHIPSGIVATAQTRSRNNSYDLALQEVQKRLDDVRRRSYTNTIATDRKQQVGSGMRGDKIRTYRFQDDVVQDHATGKRTSASKVLKGYFDQLWKE
jgi:peptide chain release factor 1